MFSKTSGKIILYLLKGPSPEGYNINQLARLLKRSVAAVHENLAILAKKGLLKKTIIGNAHYFLLDLENDETLTTCQLLLMEEKEKLESYASLYAKDLEAYAGAEMILLFGSLINSTTFNDIDVLFIAKDHEKVLRFCQELTVIRSKPFNPLIVSKTDVITALKQRKPAMVSAFQNGIVIKGEKTFIEVIAHARKKQG